MTAEQNLCWKEEEEEVAVVVRSEITGLNAKAQDKHQPEIKGMLGSIAGWK